MYIVLLQPIALIGIEKWAPRKVKELEAKGICEEGLKKYMDRPVIVEQTNGENYIIMNSKCGSEACYRKGDY